MILGWLSGLNDFRTETPYVRTNMAAIYEYWIQQIGFDGFRVDTALEVDMGCWQSFCPAIHAYAATNGNTNFFMFGETVQRFGNPGGCLYRDGRRRAVRI